MNLPTVLYLDDNPADLKLFRIAVADAGVACEVVTASEVSSALEILNQRAIDLVILDWNMPKVSGPQCLYAIRTQVEKDTPVFVFSSSARDIEVLRAEQSGATGWLQKPVNLDEFIDLIGTRLPGMLRRG